MGYKHNKTFDEPTDAIDEIRRLETLGYEPKVRVWVNVDVEELMEQAVECIETETVDSDTDSESESRSQSDSSDGTMDSTRDENKSPEELPEESVEDYDGERTLSDGHCGSSRVGIDQNQYVGKGERRREARKFFREHEGMWVSYVDFLEWSNMDLPGGRDQEKNLSSAILSDMYREEDGFDLESKMVGRRRYYRYGESDETTQEEAEADSSEEDKSPTGDDESDSDNAESDGAAISPQTNLHRVLSVMDAVDEGEGVRSGDIHEYVALEEQQVYNAIRSLDNRGFVRRTGSNRPYTYYLTPSGEEVLTAIGGYQINNSGEDGE